MTGSDFWKAAEPSFRVILPLVFSIGIFIDLWITQRVRVSKYTRTYVAFSLLSFFYGSLNMIADFLDGLTKPSHNFALDRIPELLEKFLHAQADNVVFITVGVGVFAAMDAITVTREDVKHSERQILTAIASIKVGLPMIIQPTPHRSFWRFWRRPGWLK